MRRLRWAISILGGLLAGMAIALSPEIPMWRKADVEPGNVVGFTPDGQTICTAHRMSSTTPGGIAPRICRWDVESGRLLSTLDLAVSAVGSAGDENLHARASPDGKQLLISRNRWDSTTNTRKLISEGFLCDAETGAESIGPLSNLGQIQMRLFSNDSR